MAGCQPLPHPFADDVPRRGSPMLVLRDSASVTIAPIEGHAAGNSREARTGDGERTAGARDRGERQDREHRQL